MNLQKSLRPVCQRKEIVAVSCYRKFPNNSHSIPGLLASQNGSDQVLATLASLELVATAHRVDLLARLLADQCGLHILGIVLGILLFSVTQYSPRHAIER